jgi:hypothetical protein
VLVFAVIGVAAALVYHFGVHKIHNDRPLAGPNVDVSSQLQTQSEASFSIDPRDSSLLFGATNDTSLETLRVHTSANGGKTWRGTDGPTVAGGACAHGQPLTAIDRAGREYLAFLAGTYCGDTLTPYLVVTPRDSATAAWRPLVRVVPAAWKFGYDDWPALAIDEQTGRLYLAWTRSLSAAKAVLVSSSSSDQGRTWSAPVEVSSALEHPHLASLAVAPGGDLYVAGIATTGVWIARSTDQGRTFGAVHRAARLLANPAGECALAGSSPLANEVTRCFGPNPTVLAGRTRVIVVYDDAGQNGTLDVYAAVLDRALRPRIHVQVNPPDTGKTQQIFPAAALDPVTQVAWACWFDTTYDPDAHHAWFTCSASRTGRTWSAPLAAASSAATEPPDLYGAAQKLGVTPSVAARDGVAHAFWPDGRIIDNGFDIFTVTIPQKRAFGR